MSLKACKDLNLWRSTKLKNLIRLTDYHAKDIYDIFNIADEVVLENYKDILKGKSVVLFFPNSSIRTRVTFEERNIFVRWTAYFISNGNA